MQQIETKTATNYHYGGFPPKDLDYSQLINPVSEAAAALAG